MLGLGLRHLPGAEVEDLLGEKLEDSHVVLAKRLVRLGRTDDVRDERLPVLRPLAFQNLEIDKREIKCYFSDIKEGKGLVKKIFLE
jgi:hypothetical protein